MMKFNEFKQYVETHVLTVLPPDYATAKVECKLTDRMDGQNYTGMTVTKGRASGVAVPIVNLESMYQFYEETDGDINAVMIAIAELITADFPYTDIFDRVCDYAYAKPLLAVKLMNVEDAAKYTDSPVTLVVGDLVCVYYVRIDEHHVVRINNDMMEEWGITLKQLDADAFAAMEQSETMAPVVSQFGGVMTVVTNCSGVNGAAAIFCDGVAEDICVNLMDGESYYLLPSSIHEFICCSIDGHTVEEMEAMVRTANDTDVVDDCDVLSYKIYMYDADERKVKVAK